MNRLININQLRCILLLLCLGVVFSLATAPPVAAQDADFDADFEDFDAVDAFEAKGPKKSFNNDMESGDVTLGTLKGQDAVLIYVMGDTAVFVEGP